MLLKNIQMYIVVFEAVTALETAKLVILERLE